MTIDYAERARALVGTRFRPQGRSGLGLDCVGLILETFAIPVTEVRRNYGLRGDQRIEIQQELRRYFTLLRNKDARAGDVMLLQAGVEQFHLAVRTMAGFVHAHAGIGRVVETPGEPQWPLLAAYRRRVCTRDV